MENETTIYKSKLEKYKIGLDLIKFEGTLLWQIFNSFFIAHTIIIGFIATLYVQSKNSNYILFLIAGSIGFIIAILWLGTFHRNSKWYYFRMLQVKNIEGEDWKCNQEYKLSFLKEGEKVSKENPFLSNKNAGYVMITIFISIYIFIILWSFCKLCCNC